MRARTTVGSRAQQPFVGSQNAVSQRVQLLADANGLMTSGAGRAVTATTFDMAAAITDGSNSATFSYDADHARYKMVTAGVNAGTTYYLNSSGATEEEYIAGGATSWRDYIMADGKLLAERFCTGAAPCSGGATYTYFVLVSG